MGQEKKRDNALFVEDSQTPSMVLRRQHHHATQAKSRRAGKKNGALNVVAGTCARARARVAFMGTCAACLPGTADMLAPPATGRAVAMAMAMH